MSSPCQKEGISFVLDPPFPPHPHPHHPPHLAHLDGGAAGAGGRHTAALHHSLPLLSDPTVPHSKNTTKNTHDFLTIPFGSNTPQYKYYWNMFTQNVHTKYKYQTLHKNADWRMQNKLWISSGIAMHWNACLDLMIWARPSNIVQQTDECNVIGRLERPLTGRPVPCYYLFLSHHSNTRRKKGSWIKSALSILILWWGSVQTKYSEQS